MNSHNEILSALVDGELEGENLDYALNLLAKDEQARAQFQRYQLASDVLHGHAAYYDTDLTDNITAFLVDSAVPISKTDNKVQIITFPGRLWKQAVGVAVAASLAVLVVSVQYESDTVPLVPSVAVNDQSVSTVAVDKTREYLAMGGSKAEYRINNYMTDHNADDHELALLAYMQLSADMAKTNN